MFRLIHVISATIELIIIKNFYQKICSVFWRRQRSFYFSKFLYRFTVFILCVCWFLSVSIIRQRACEVLTFSYQWRYCSFYSVR